MLSENPILLLDVSASYGSQKDVLKQVSFAVNEGEIFGLAGESGSGKSTIALCILRLLGMKGGRVRGSIRFQGLELNALSEREMRKIRGRDVGLVLQSPLSSLNPALSIGTQMKETWRAHATDRAAWKRRALELLERVSLPTDDEFLGRRPAQLSVGQAQRVLIAMAIMHNPKLLIADEPTSALDMITAREILDLFGQLNRELGTAILFISHDLYSVGHLCQRIAIMRSGELVEVGSAADIFLDPAHPYTRKLIASMPEGFRKRSAQQPALSIQSLTAVSA